MHELAGWHTEIYIDAGELADLAAIIGALPKVSIDHLGLSKAGLPDLLRLAERGVWRSAYEDPQTKTRSAPARAGNRAFTRARRRFRLTGSISRCAGLGEGRTVRLRSVKVDSPAPGSLGRYRYQECIDGVRMQSPQVASVDADRTSLAR